MRGLSALIAVVVLASGCATGPESTEQEAEYFSNCRNSQPEGAETSLSFAGDEFHLHWQRRCQGSRARVFKADGSDDDATRLVTLAMYPPSAEIERTMDAYIARSAGKQVGEPRVFERGASGPQDKQIAELMLRRESVRELEYVLHGVAATDSGRVVSVTYTHRFSADGQDPAGRIKARQARWLQSLERLLAGFPDP